jgi:hypothetical protein
MESNEYKKVAQANKILAMVSVIDRAAIERKPPIDPHGNAGQVLLALLSYTKKHWEVVDKVARLKSESSPEVREMVKTVYRDRANNDPLKVQ